MTLPVKKRVLLAEDDAAMRRFIEVVLRQAGYEVTAAEDGLEAMQLALENDFEAVVADALMPQMSGYDLCRMIRSQTRAGKIPCIILSGFSDINEDEAVADVFLEKGTNLKDELIGALLKLL